MIADTLSCVLVEQLNHAQWAITSVPGWAGVNNWATVMSDALECGGLYNVPVITRTLDGVCRVMAAGCAR